MADDKHNKIYSVYGTYYQSINKKGMPDIIGAIGYCD